MFTLSGLTLCGVEGTNGNYGDNIDIFLIKYIDYECGETKNRK